MKSYVFYFILVVFITSCGEESEPTVEGRKEFASYDIIIEGSEGGPHHLVGENVDSRWRSDDGYIWLGTDEVNLPTGTITIYIQSVPESGSSVVLTNATVAKSDVLVPTSGNQANARTFKLLQGSETIATGALDSVEIGANYISAKLELLMERVTVFPDDAEELVTVKGKFVAISQ